MSTDKIIHELVLLYDTATVSNTAPKNIPKDSLREAKITDIPGFEQRCSIMAWQIAYLKYKEQNQSKSHQDFVKECVGTLAGLSLYRDAFSIAETALDKDLTIAKLLKFQAS